ncbi:MAG: hypothetical protein K2I14_04175 [Eubacterium sp.]|nr:hypothetical protein [Eubacterium sp.]
MELFRILKNKKFIAAVIVLLLLNCVAFYITQQKSIEDFGINIGTYSDVFRENADIFSESDTEDTILEKSNRFQILKSFADTEKLKAENAEEYEFFAEEEALLIQENPALYQEYKDSVYSYEEISALTNFYSHFSYQLEYQNGYQAYIDSIIEKGKALSSKKLFSDKNSFSYKSIQKSTEDFSGNRDLNLTLVNDLPASSVLNYQTGDFILILLCVFLAVSFLAEKDVNLLIHTCKNGRRILRLKQLPVLILFSVFCASFIYISEILISLKIYHAPFDLYAAIQSSDMFSDCILHINLLQLFVIHILFKAIFAAMIALVIWLLISLSSNIILVCGIAGTMAAAELLLYKNISAQSNLSFFKTFNIFTLFDYKSIMDYNLISVFSVPVRADIIVWAIVLLIAFVVSVSVILSAKNNYPIKTPNKAFRIVHILFNRLSEVYTKLQSIFYAGRFETYKIMHTGRGILVAAVFFAVIVFSFNTNTLVFSSTELFLNDYYAEYAGELNDAVYNSIDTMQAELEAVDEEYNFKSTQYVNGKISFEEYDLARAKHDAYGTQRKAVDKLTAQVDRIEQLSDEGIEPVLINETGYNNLFFNQSNQTEILLLICAVVIIFSSVFSIEKTSNMLALNHCSKNGREQLYLKKILTVIPKMFVLTLISYVSLLIQNNYLYELGNLNADIRNLECLQDIGLNISISDYIILNFAFEFIFVTVIGLMIASLSVFMSQLAVIIVSACVFILPSALYMINIYSAKAMSASFLFNFNSLVLDKGLSISSFILHFAFILICIVLLCLCKRRWCLTRGR